MSDLPEGTQEVAMTDAAAAMREFADKVTEMVEAETMRIARAYAARERIDPAGHQVTWRFDLGQPTRVEITFASGQTIRGEGPAKLEALADLEASYGLAEGLSSESHE